MPRRHWLHPRVPGATHQDRVRWRRRAELLAGGGATMLVSDGAYHAEFDAQPAFPGGDDLLEVLTVSVFVRVNPGATSQNIFTTNRFGTDRDFLTVTPSEDLNWRTATWLGAQLANITSTGTLLDDGEIHHCMANIDTDAGTTELFIDGVSVAVNNAIATGTQTGDSSDWYVCARDSGGQVYGNNSEIGNLWVSDEYVANPVGVFIDSAGNPLTGGSDGSVYTGRQPTLYLEELADWNSGTNRGYGGNLVVKAGALSAA